MKRKYTKPSTATAKKRKTYKKPVRRYARKANMPRQINSNMDALKVRMSRTIQARDMVTTSSDGSRYCNIYFCPSRNITTAFSGGQCNLFYHPDFESIQTLYQQYKVTCVVIKLDRPDQYVIDTNSDNYLREPNHEWGTQILHARTVYKPDTTLNAVQTATDLTPRVILYHPTTYKECVDDGARRFHICPHWRKSVTRTYKPSTQFEKRWVNRLYDDTELAKGGMHIRIKDGNAGQPSIPGLNQSPQQVLFNITATVYMAFKERL